MYSIEDGKENRIRTTKYLTEAIQYAITDENAKEIFEFDENDEEVLGCVWTKEYDVKCATCGSTMKFVGNNSDDYYIENEYICQKCNTISVFKSELEVVE